MSKHGLIVATLLAFCGNWLQAVENSPATPTSLREVLERIHQHVEANAWREAGWKEEQIEGWLENVTGKIAKAANFPELTLPVRLAEVKPSDETNPQSQKNSLLIGRSFNGPKANLSHCIVLADGNVTANRLENCVVVARGVVSAASSNSSVIVAGAYVRILADGETGETDNGSLLITPGWAQLDVINGTVVAAGEGVTTGLRMEGGIFVNATLVLGEVGALSMQRRPRSVKVRDLAIGELVNHPLYEQLQVRGVVYREVIEASDRLGFAAGLLNRNEATKPQPTGVVLRFAGKRYIANLDQAVVSQANQTVEGLAGWTLSYVNNKIAVFSTNEADAIVQLEEP